ncbi:MAG TPA: flavin reductase family protein [Trebonia sp.]|jgi:flavin reductase (DIM6/NTAB) family NADH-FMN oxidoreductase RutF|nr:flavin reductase family protein [Trebonia sp.]
MTAVNDTSCESPDASAGVSPAELREAMGHFATGVTVITSVGPDGEPVGTTANAVTSLSLDPPLILVCFDLKSSTLTAIREHGAFAVNVLGQRQRQLSANFAKRGLAAVWEGVTHHRGPTGSPRLANVIAVIECTMEHALPGGDHEIVIGRVRHVETNGDGATPLLFWRGQYATVENTTAADIDGFAPAPFSW